MSMEINTKQLAIIAAIGGAAWFLMRKKSTNADSVIVATKPATMPASGSSGIWGGFGVGGSLYDAMGQAPGSMAPPPAAQAPAAAPPATAPAASSGGFVIGGGSTPADFNNPQPTGQRNPNDPGRMTAEEYAIYSGAVSRLPA